MLKVIIYEREWRKGKIKTRIRNAIYQRKIEINVLIIILNSINKSSDKFLIEQ